MNVLEINDTGLLLSDGARVIAESPGFAALEGKALHVGAAARARSRLDPRRAFSRFWYQLEATLPAPAGAARSHADLAFAHLQSLREIAGDAPLILAAPGTLSREQLAILLGLIEMGAAIISDGTYIAVAATARNALAGSGAVWLNRIAGAILIGAAVWLALQTRA